MSSTPASRWESPGGALEGECCGAPPHSHQVESPVWAPGGIFLQAPCVRLTCHRDGDLAPQRYRPEVCWLPQQKRRRVLAVLSWTWRDGVVFGDRLRVLARMPPRETCQPVYFVSRAQTVIRSQFDIINTRKGQHWAGCGTEHTHTAELDLARGQPQTSSGYPVQGGGTWQGPGRRRPSHRTEVRVSLLLLPKEEKCHFLSGSSS